MLPDAGIPVRRSARHEIVLPARLSVHRDHARLVRLGAGVGDHEGAIRADLIDLSRGGVGFLTTQFFPKECLLRMRVYGLHDADGGALLDGRVRVQRVTMTDSRPGYLLGAAFDGNDAVFEHDLELLLHRLDHEHAPPQAPEGAP